MDRVLEFFFGRTRNLLVQHAYRDALVSFGSGWTALLFQGDGNERINATPYQNSFTPRIKLSVAIRLRFNRVFTGEHVLEFEAAFLIGIGHQLIAAQDFQSYLDGPGNWRAPRQYHIPTNASRCSLAINSPTEKQRQNKGYAPPETHLIEPGLNLADTQA